MLREFSGLIPASLPNSGVRVDAAEEGPSNASGDAVVNADLAFNEALASLSRECGDLSWKG
jgi:hypothetical protein